MSKWNDTKCSFCGKSQSQVAKIIAGPGPVYICNECVGLCDDILGERLHDPPSTSAGPDVLLDDEPERAQIIRHERRLLLAAKLRALEDMAAINEAVRASRDRREAVDLLTQVPFSFREIEAHTILDTGIGQQTVGSMTRLRQEIAGFDDRRPEMPEGLPDTSVT
jgi:hypothetical protein